jgi:hypothetical protein
MTRNRHFQSVALDRFEEGLCLLGGQVRRVLALDARPSHGRRGVAADESVACGDVERRPQDGVDRPDRRRRQAGVPLGDDERFDIRGTQLTEGDRPDRGHEVRASEGGVEVLGGLLSVACGQ